jgi:hypothetical protein
MRNSRVILALIVVACAVAFAFGFATAASAAAGPDCQQACTSDCGPGQCEYAVAQGCGCVWWCSSGEGGQIICGL